MKCLGHFRLRWRHFENFRKKKINLTLGGVFDILFLLKHLCSKKYLKCFEIMCHVTKMDNFQRNWSFWPQKWWHDHMWYSCRRISFILAYLQWTHYALQNDMSHDMYSFEFHRNDFKAYRKILFVWYRDHVTRNQEKEEITACVI